MAKNTELSREVLVEGWCLLVQEVHAGAPVEKRFTCFEATTRGAAKGELASAEDQSGRCFVSMDAASIDYPSKGVLAMPSNSVLRGRESSRDLLPERHWFSYVEALAHKGALTTEALGKFLGPYR